MQVVLKWCRICRKRLSATGLAPRCTDPMESPEPSSLTRPSARLAPPFPGVHADTHVPGTMYRWGQLPISATRRSLMSASSELEHRWCIELSPSPEQGQCPNVDTVRGCARRGTDALDRVGTRR